MRRQPSPNWPSAPWILRTGGSASYHFQAPRSRVSIRITSYNVCYTKLLRGWSLLAAIIILCREILVSGLREYLAELRVGVPVTRLAKWKTIVQMVAVGFLIAGPAGDKIVPVVTPIGILMISYNFV